MLLQMMVACGLGITWLDLGMVSVMTTRQGSKGLLTWTTTIKEMRKNGITCF